MSYVCDTWQACVYMCSVMCGVCGAACLWGVRLRCMCVLCAYVRCMCVACMCVACIRGGMWCVYGHACGMCVGVRVCAYVV